MVLLVVDTQKLITNDRYYNHFIWKDRYAQCIPLEETLELMKQ